MNTPPVMPAFCQGTHGFHHTLSSSLEILGALGVSSSRITIQTAGPGWPAYWIVAQSPAAGTALSLDVPVSLSIAGASIFRSLPAGMWDTGGEQEPGTREIVALFDDPLEKAGHWLRQGARLLDVRRDNLPACARWLKLFGIDADAWPRDKWYELALLLPNLNRLAGKESGIRLVLQLLLSLPLKAILQSRDFTWLRTTRLTRLGSQASRLGRDFVVGDRLEGLERLTLVIGPVSLATYRSFETDDMRRQLDAVLALCAPCYQRNRIQWIVSHEDRNPRIGVEEENARLGINSHMGRVHKRTSERRRQMA